MGRDNGAGAQRATKRKHSSRSDLDEAPSGAREGSQTADRESLVAQLCASWNLRSIDPFFTLLDAHSGHSLPGVLTLEHLSIGHLSILCRAAKFWDLSDTTNLLAARLRCCDSAPRSKSKSPSAILTRKILNQVFYHMENQASEMTEEHDNSTQVKDQPIYVPKKINSSDKFGQSELSSFDEEANNNASQYTGIPPFVNIHIPIGTAKAAYDSMPSQSQKDELLRLDKKVASVALEREGYIVEELHTQILNASVGLERLAEEKTQEHHVKTALILLRKLRSECSLAFHQGESSESPASMLKTLEDDALSRENKQPRNYSDEQASLTERKGKASATCVHYEAQLQSILKVGQYYKDQRPDLE